jgi:chromosome segregation ATPase
VLLISVQSGMLLALGFLLASLLGLLLASAFWSRAVRLTTARLKQSMPVSEPEIRAERDKLKAEHAVKVHKLATQLEQAKLERARHLIEINRRDASISALETDAVAIKTELEEHQNARRVLEQTVADRLPRVEARLAEAKRVLFQRDREIAELTQNAPRPKSDGTSPTSAHNLELEALKEKLRDHSDTIDTLRRQIELSASARDGRAQGPAVAAEADEALAAKIEDQAAEIARLKAALEAFEKPAKTGLLGGGVNKQALKARAESAEAQVERQAATIEKLRTDLATAHQRLARQAAHFKETTHRPGVGEAPELRVEARDAADRRRNLVDRVAYVRPALRGEPDAPPSLVETAANGNGVHSEDKAEKDRAEAAVAEMPQNPRIEGKPKMRLLDRLTDVRKS